MRFFGQRTTEEHTVKLKFWKRTNARQQSDASRASRVWRRRTKGADLAARYEREGKTPYRVNGGNLTGGPF
jgi:hypothetical protein